MKTLSKYFTLLLLVAVSVSACTEKVPELEDPASLQAKTITNVKQYYAKVSPSSGDAYAMQVTQYSDGSVDVARSIVAQNAFQNYSMGNISGAYSMISSATSATFTFGPNSWYIPFDPGISAISVSGVSRKYDCECTQGSGCDFRGYINSDGTMDLGCEGTPSCTGNCLAHISFSVATNGTGIFLQTADLNLL
ncbi:MAG: hypothetical protein AAF998_00110 [Bacteroidota bacterium]